VQNTKLNIKFKYAARTARGREGNRRNGIKTDNPQCYCCCF